MHSTLSNLTDIQSLQMKLVFSQGMEFDAVGFFIPHTGKCGLILNLRAHSLAIDLQRDKYSEEGLVHSSTSN
jgi:hypothetical protein